jgi:hypothetical protein
MPLRVLDPTYEDNATLTSGSARLTTLAECTIGLLDNGKVRVRELLDHVEAMLRSQYGVARVLRFKKPDFTRPAPAEIVAALASCAAVICAVGD